MNKMKKQLIKLLNIHGVSGNETPVRNYLKPILCNLMDKTFVDDYGNLLAEKKCGDGDGATVLLSAHMDTVKGVLKDRNLIVTDDGIIMSDKGALGADDRAGIAIILSVLYNLPQKFNGTIKVAFSREEEIGCVGASRIDKNWYADVDLAIVVDRRGNRDIVAGCGGAFCSDSVGLFMENVSVMLDMDWKCVEGGISDAMVFAEAGINSVNLSAGYLNEHTDKEIVVLKDMKDTTKLILQTIAIINQFYKNFDDVGFENKWSKSWSKYPSYSSYGYSYYEDSYIDDIWAEEDDVNGEVFIYELDGRVIIQQNDQEVILNRGTLESLLGQLGYTKDKTLQ